MNFFKDGKDKENASEGQVSELKAADAFSGEEGVTAHKVMQQKEQLLTFIGSWRHKGLKSKEAEKQLAVLTRKVIQAQTDHLDYQLKIGGDRLKKEDYAKYLQDIQVINENIVQVSSKAAQRLINISYDIDDESFENEKIQIDRFRKKFEEGKLTQEQLDRQIEKIQASTIGLQKHGEKMVENILANTMDTFDTAIKLFDENKITAL